MISILLMLSNFGAIYEFSITELSQNVIENILDNSLHAVGQIVRFEYGSGPSIIRILD